MMQRALKHPVGRALIVYSVMLIMLILAVVLLQPVLMPLAASFILFSVLDPLKTNMLRRGLNEPIAIMIVLIGLVAAVVLLLVLGVPVVLDQLDQVLSKLPVIWKTVGELMNKFGASVVNMTGLKMGTQPGVRWMSDIQEWGATAMVSSAGIMMQSAISLVLIPLITFFLLRDYRKMRNIAMSWLPNASYELGWVIYYKVAKKLQRYIRSVFLQSAIVAAVTSLGFYFIGLETAMLFGVLAGLFNLIPYIGPLLAVVPPVLATLATGNPDPMMLISIVSVVLVAQIIDNVVVIPALIAQTVGLHPLLVLLGVIVFGFFFGFIGMLVAIPVLSTSKIILSGLIHGLRRELSEDTLRIS